MELERGEEKERIRGEIGKGILIGKAEEAGAWSLGRQKGNKQPVVDYQRNNYLIYDKDG